MSQHVVVVGAGPGGLAVALLLAHAGLRVTVLERRGQVGGRTSTLELDGFRFDTGPTFFLYPPVLADIFAAVGRDLWADVPMHRLDPQYHLVFGAGGELKATPDVARMEAEVAALCPDDARNLRRFLADNRTKLDRFEPILQRPFLGWKDLFHWKVLRSLPLLRPWLSLDAELARYFRDPRVRLAFSFQAKYLGMSPFRCPGLFSILSFLEYEHGVFHPFGGCGAVTQRMADIAEEMGVDVRLNEGVEELEFRGRRVVGVRTAQDYYPTDALVLNADFAGAIMRLVPDRLRRRWSDERIARKKFSCSTFMMYLGVEGRFPELAHHTIYLAKDYLQNLDDIENRHVLSADPSFYVQNACVTDGTLAPKGMSALYVLSPVTHQHPNVDWTRERDSYRSLVLKQLARIGLDNVERRIRVEKIVTPADWEVSHKLYRGATFSLAHSLGQMLHLRPRNRFEDVDGVYLVGGGTHPGSGLPVIFESARITSRLLLKELRVPAGAEMASEASASSMRWTRRRSCVVSDGSMIPQCPTNADWPSTPGRPRRFRLWLLGTGVSVLALGLLWYSAFSTRWTAFRRTYQQAEFHLEFRLTDGKPLEGVQLIVEDDAGNRPAWTPIHEYDAQAPPRSDANGLLVFRHTHLLRMYHGRTRYLFGIPLGDRLQDDPRYRLSFRRHGKELHSAWFDDLCDEAKALAERRGAERVKRPAPGPHPDPDWRSAGSYYVVVRRVITVKEQPKPMQK